MVEFVLYVYDRSQVTDSQVPKQLIMEPFNFSTFLERNLSASWYRDIPTIKVDANFKTLKVNSLTTHCLSKPSLYLLETTFEVC